MKITYISKSTIPSQTANSVHVMKMSNSLSKHFKVTLVGKQGNQFSSDDFYEIYNVEKRFNLNLFEQKLFNRFNYLMHVRRIIKRCKDHENIYYTRYLMSIRYLIKNNKKFIYEAHDIPKKRRHKILLKKSFKSKAFLKLVVISESLKTEYLSMFKCLEDDKVLVLPDAADVIVNGYIKKPNFNNIGYVGSLYDGRGIDMILNLSKELPNHSFHIVGGTKNQINKLKNNNDLPNVIFYGHLNQKELIQVYKNFSIALAPYQDVVAVAGNKGNTVKYMSPLKIFEYMSHKKIIICSDFPVIREVLTNKENGFLVNSKNKEEWVFAIKWINENPKEAKKIIENSYDLFLKNYTWDSRANKIKEILVKG